MIIIEFHINFPKLKKLTIDSVASVTYTVLRGLNELITLKVILMPRGFFKGYDGYMADPTVTLKNLRHMFATDNSGTPYKFEKNEIKIQSPKLEEFNGLPDSKKFRPWWWFFTNPMAAFTNPTKKDESVANTIEGKSVGNVATPLLLLFGCNLFYFSFFRHIGSCSKNNQPCSSK